MNKIAVGYIRVSTLKQVKGHSLDYQQHDIEKHCEAKGLELKKLFIDKGLSGYKHRPKFEEMKKYLETHDVGFVVTYTITRYGRSTQDLLFQINELDSKGIQFISVKEQIDISTKTGRLLLGLLALIADFEAETIKERMEAGRAWAKEHGTKSGKPFGRPKSEIDWDRVKDLREHNVSWTKTASIVGVSTPTLITRAKEEGIF